jgi:hypothetical protein
MNVEVYSDGKPAVVESAASQFETDAVVRPAWRRPTVTIIDMERTMVAHAS